MVKVLQIGKDCTVQIKTMVDINIWSCQSESWVLQDEQKERCVSIFIEKYGRSIPGGTITMRKRMFKKDAEQTINVYRGQL